MKLYTIRAAAERLAIKPATLRFWIWTNRVEYIKVGRGIRISDDTIQTVIERGTVPAKRG